MIRIERAAEPPALGPLRSHRLAAARLALDAGKAIDFTGYGVVKAELFAMQHNKCCYCEKLQEQAKYRDVEHYRPKAIYWWLAWTWDNLLFACVDCNREYKRDQFPLASGSTRLDAGHAPPGAEQPLVLDPSDPTLDPTQEIEFRRDRVHGNERWKPYGLTPRGTQTIEVCGLDRPGLLTHYTYHVNHVVRPKLERFFEAIGHGDAQAVVRAWGKTLRGLLDPAQPFRALSHDSLAVLVKAPLRERYGVLLPRPAPR